MQKGVKYNKNKLEMGKLFIQFPEALKAVMLASSFGHIKYKKYDEDWLNYQRVGGSSTYNDAGVRHQLLHFPEQEESGLPPIFHQAWNKMAELEIFLKENNINVSKLAEDKLTEWNEDYKI